MHGVAVRLTRTVLPRWLNNQPSSSGGSREQCSLVITKGAERLSNDYARLLVERSSTLLTPAVCGEEGPIDRAVRAEKHVLGHNWTATFDVPRESVSENRGNAQPEYPLRGFPRL